MPAEIPILLDVTHLMLRTQVRSPTGIDRVSLSFAKHLPDAGLTLEGIHLGLARPRVATPTILSDLVRIAGQAQDGVAEAQSDVIYGALVDWLAAGPPPRPVPGTSREGAMRISRPPASLTGRAKTALRVLKLALACTGTRSTAEAVYLSVAQPGLWGLAQRRWLRNHPAIHPVFFIHDLFPIDYPEYFEAGYQKHFSPHFASMVQCAAAFMVASDCVSARLRRELVRHGRPSLPIHVAALPTPGSYRPEADEDPELQRTPYFVICGTIEPRKNHLLLLNIWRDLASGRGRPPKLVMVGKRGWENEQVLDMLARCSALREHVIEVAGLSTAALRRLMSNANAVLCPSFDEGYGFPMVEALAVGTPVVASDIAACREATQGCAIYRHPLDGTGWKEAIDSLSLRQSTGWLDAKSRAARYRVPTWQGYSEALSGFLQEIASHRAAG